MDAAAQRPTVAQLLLGLFISWQLLFLPAANYLAFIPHGAVEEGELSDSRRVPAQSASSGPVRRSLQLAAEIADDWSFLSGQVQAWWLFAPEVPRSSTFPIVELSWDEGTTAETIPPLRLRTILEPNDPQCYFRPPSSFDRLFHYEVRLGLAFANWNERTLAERPEFWRGIITERVRRQWRSMRAYLRWYVHHFEHLHPELPPPDQAILWIRIYPTPEPGQASSSGPNRFDQPLARWHPKAPPRPGELPIEAFDPVAKCFVGLHMKD